ncbi:MAG: phosphoglucosamine mutase [Bacillota bacterium]
MDGLFGTDGVRGIANIELTPELAFKIGRTSAEVLKNNDRQRAQKQIILGRDTRISGDMLSAAVIAGVTSTGINIIDLGIVPTPVVSYSTKEQPVIGGIMISASHNPIEDNGIKIFSADGCKLSPELELQIEDKLELNASRPTHANIGQRIKNEDLIENYINNVTSASRNNWVDLKIVLDCGQGAGYKIGPEILKRLAPKKLTVINNDGKGELINVNCGSTDTSRLAEKVIAEKADIGIALDGDADRSILVDNKGQEVDGDKIMFLSAKAMAEKNNLNANTIVATEYSNLGLDESLQDYDIEVIKVANGDRFVLEKMKAENLNLGGEKSGHIIFLDYNTSGDGILTAVQMIDIIAASNKSLNELTKEFKSWPQLLYNVKVKDKNWETNQNIKEVIKKAKSEVNPGRVFIRASGTEPVMRLMLEGKDVSKLEYWQKKIAQIIREELA